jgi:PTS system N-acetylglucosamine-specific IIC component
MSGFFPVMMFWLPGACLAMYHTARADRRAGVAGLLLSLGLTTFLTGVTEPVEFTFMFLAPILYALHAVATGLAMVLMNLLGVRLGFSFSAGLFDYVLNFNHAQRPLLLLPIGALYFALYYGVFRLCIVRLNLATPGREADDEAPPAIEAVPAGARGPAFIAALGGARNLAEVAACTTRLRLLLLDNGAVDEAALKRLGSRGLLRSSTQGLQVVLGPIADQVAGEIRDALRQSTVGAEADGGTDGARLLTALGGRPNVLEVETGAGRLLVSTAQTAIVDEQALRTLGIRGVARPSGASLQLIVSGGAEETAASLRRLLAAERAETAE